MFVENQVLNNCYQILQPLGNGGTSSVYLAYHLRLEKYVVIKRLRGNIANPALLRTEADILKNLHHHCLPQVYDYIQEQDHIYTVIDFVDGYDLDAYIQSRTEFPEELLKRYLRQIADVLDYLHSQPIPVIHSDIKPGNIIIDQTGNVILIDFNTSIGANQGNLLGLTLPYASPEQILLAQYTASYQATDLTLDGRSDIYSLGATFYELISGIQPTPGVRPQPLQSMHFPQYSKGFLEMIDRMMAEDRDRRYQSAGKLVTAIDRMDGRYRSTFAQRCVSLLLSGVIIAGGAYCLLYGIRQEKVETYQRSYQMAMSMVSTGNLAEAEQTCVQMLSGTELNDYLSDHPGELARVYHILGDVYFYQEQFGDAAEYYSAALSCGGLSSQEKSVYLRDAAIAYAQRGDLQSAQRLLEEAKGISATSIDVRLASIVIDARSGNLEQCITNARVLLEECQDAELCYRTAMCVATASTDLDQRIEWLKIAQSYQNSIVLRRMLAHAHAEKATEDGAKNSLRESIKLYEQLCAEPYASSEDKINYAVVLMMNDQSVEAKRVLERAMEADPNNYRIQMQLCFVYDALQDEAKIVTLCKKAIAAWKADQSPNKLSVNSDEIYKFRELAKRYGIGGI